MKVRKRSDGKGYLFDAGVIDGERIRKSFPTEKEARAEMRRFGEMRRNLGDRAAEVDPEEIGKFLLAKRRLADVGGTWEEAVEFYLRHGRPVKEAVGLRDLLRLWLASRGPRRSSRHVGGVRATVQSFFEEYGHGETLANEVPAADLAEFLVRAEWAPATQAGQKRNLSALFSWGVEQGYVSRNPVEGILTDDPDLMERPIEYLSVEDCARLLRGAWEDDAALLPYFVLAMFAGIRRAELGRLDLEAVDLEAREVRIGEATNKGRRRGRSVRHVDLSANAVAWLRQGPLEGPACPVNFRKRFDRIKAVIQPWPQNALRHTFPTYHYAVHRNAALLQALMGHEDVETTERHYRGLAKREEAERFWELRP